MGILKALEDFLFCSNKPDNRSNQWGDFWFKMEAASLSARMQIVTGRFVHYVCWLGKTESIAGKFPYG